MHEPPRRNPTQFSYHFQAIENKSACPPSLQLPKINSLIINMDSFSSSNSIEETKRGIFSCWGRLKMKLPWTKRRIRSNTNKKSQRSNGSTPLDCTSMASLATVQPKPVGGFRYDPLSYSQNFDDGCWKDDLESSSHRSFVARYSAPLSKSHMGDKSQKWIFNSSYTGLSIRCSKVF